MKDLEKAIEKAANDSSDGAWSESDWYHGFRIGAKSPEAKAFHTQGMYTEDEVWILLAKNVNVYLDWFATSLQNPEQGKLNKPDLLKWFEQNKKK